MNSSYEQNRIKGVHQGNEQRIAILDSAQAVFLEKGLGKTTMGDIAKEAGIHRATMYR